MLALASAVTSTPRAKLYSPVTFRQVGAFRLVMRRAAALGLLVLGQSLVATLDPAVALMPAFATFLVAGTIMAKQTLTDAGR